MLKTKPSMIATVVLLSLGLTACGGGSGSDSVDEAVADIIDVIDDVVTETPTTYTFTSAFSDESSVSYSGQTARQVLIAELNTFISNLDVNDYATGAELKAELLRRYEGESADDLLTITTTPAVLQSSVGDISSDKNLVDKIAGNDATGQHQDWNTVGIVGWAVDDAVISPDNLVRLWFQKLADNVDTELAGTTRTDYAGNLITKLYIQEDGTDLKQLIQKFLLGAVNYSQGTDDYLDNDIEDKGLLSDNISQDGESPYTSLEHQFDEGFGYFGAARDFNNYTDQEINDADLIDTDEDGAIDLKSEFNFGHSTNAAKRDLGASEPTDFTKDAFDAFLAGRQIINSAAGDALSDEEAEALYAQRDIAVLAWEKAIAATVVHYVNDTTGDLKILIDTNGDLTGYTADNFADLAKHWSELKGFALSLQFNPRSQLTADQFAQVQEKITMAPAISVATIVDDATAFSAALAEVNVILQQAYSFDAANVAEW